MYVCIYTHTHSLTLTLTQNKNDLAALVSATSESHERRDLGGQGGGSHIGLGLAVGPRRQERLDHLHLALA